MIKVKKLSPDTKRKSPSPETRFHVGSRPNRPGRKKLPLKARALAKISRETIIEVYDRLMRMTREDIATYYRNPTISAIEALVARAIISGDMDDLDRILDRVIGRVPQRLEHGGHDGAPLIPPTITYQPVQHLPTSGEPPLALPPSTSVGTPDAT